MVITKKLLHGLSPNVHYSIFKRFSKISYLIMRCDDTKSCIKFKIQRISCLFAYVQILHETLSDIINVSPCGGIETDGTIASVKRLFFNIVIKNLLFVEKSNSYTICVS